MKTETGHLQFWGRQKPLLIAAGCLLCLVIIFFGLSAEGRRVGLFVIGLLLGVTLLKAMFGFTAAYRRAMLYRDYEGVKAQLLMLLVGSALFAPILAEGEAFGHGVTGAVAPLGVQLLAGAFLFGVGMQLAGGCGSGTLFTLGGGSSRMLFTLIAFIAGSFWASLDMPWWWGLPSLPALSLGREFGWWPAFAMQAVVLLLLFYGLQSKSPSSNKLHPGNPRPRSGGLWLGPWNLYVGGMLLAGLNWATLLLAGHPWTITWGFTLWGAKSATILGWEAEQSAFWSGAFQQTALQAPLLQDNTSLMNIGIIIGAFFAATLSNRFAPVLQISWPSLLAAVLGGLAMGYGARIGFGCNIGAFFSGILSTSLHGWVWIVLALAGTWIGIRLRPLFGMSN